MDAGMAIKPVFSVANAPAQTSIGPAPAAPNALPHDKTVGPIVHSEPAQNEPRQADHSSDQITHDAIIDPRTNMVVYRVIDPRTREVLQQEPNPAALRAQAYARAQAVCALTSGKHVPAPVSEVTIESKVDTMT